MRKCSLMLGALALAAGAVPAHASTITRLTFENECTTGAMMTCASVQVRFVQPGDYTMPMLRIGLRNPAGPSSVAFSSKPVRFGQLLSQNDDFTMTRPNILSLYNLDGRVIECRPGGMDCRESTDPTTTTPEPVTMTLVATGLVGMGVGRLRRRKKGELPA